MKVRKFIITLLIAVSLVSEVRSEYKQIDANEWLSKNEEAVEYIRNKIYNEESYESRNIKLRFCNSVTLLIGHSMLVQGFDYVPDGIDVIAIGGANIWKIIELMRELNPNTKYDRIVIWSMINDIGSNPTEFSEQTRDNLLRANDKAIKEAFNHINIHGGGSVYVVKECMRGNKPFLDEYIYNANKYLSEYDGIRVLEQKYYLDSEHSSDGIHYKQEYRKDVILHLLDQIVSQESRD